MLCWYMRISHQCVSWFLSVIDFVKRYRFSTQICQDEWILYVFAYSFLYFSISKCVVTLYLWTFQFSTLARGLCVALSCWTIFHVRVAHPQRDATVVYPRSRIAGRCHPGSGARWCSSTAAGRCNYIQGSASHMCVRQFIVCAQEHVGVCAKRRFSGRELYCCTLTSVGSCWLSQVCRCRVFWVVNNSCCHAVEI